jgi:hypothetical protein
MPTSETSNTTRFAERTLEATALILDALITLGGENRRTKLTQAQNLVYLAIENACDEKEMALGVALNSVIKKYEANGLDR